MRSTYDSNRNENVNEKVSELQSHLQPGYQAPLEVCSVSVCASVREWWRLPHRVAMQLLLYPQCEDDLGL